MQATDHTRYDCLVGAKRIKYTVLTHRYVCNECGGRIVTRYNDGYYACCGVCGAQDFISEYKYSQQAAEAWEVKRGLPAHLRALLD